MLDNILDINDSSIKGIILVPFGVGNDLGFKQKWFDF
jgi:hypothetical protein